MALFKLKKLTSAVCLGVFNAAASTMLRGWFAAGSGGGMLGLPAGSGRVIRGRGAAVAGTGRMTTTGVGGGGGGRGRGAMGAEGGGGGRCASKAGSMAKGGGATTGVVAEGAGGAVSGAGGGTGALAKLEVDALRAQSKGSGYMKDIFRMLSRLGTFSKSGCSEGRADVVKSV